MSLIGKRSLSGVRRLGVLVTIAMLVGGCSAGQGSSSPSVAGGSGSASTVPDLGSVTLRLPYLALGYDAPFYLALENGSYRDAGLDVEIAEGKGSPVTAQSVAQGNDEFGFADASAMAILIADGAPIKVVSGVTQKGSPSFAFRAPVELSKPADLVGKTILGTGGNNDLLLEAVLAKNGMKMSDIGDITLVQAAQAQQAFLNTENAVYLTNVFADAAALKVKDPSVKTILYSDWGVNLLGYGIGTSETMISERPEVVKAFVTASMKGWQAAADDPQAAVDALLKHFPDSDPKLVRAQLDATLPLQHSDRTKDQPLGCMTQEDWQEALDVLIQYQDLKPDVPATDYYTNEFLPCS